MMMMMDDDNIFFFFAWWCARATSTHSANNAHKTSYRNKVLDLSIFN